MSATSAPLPAARARDAERYALAGHSPSIALRPADAGEAAAVLAECARRGWSLVPWGGGVALSLETAPPPRYDVALDLGALRRIVAYEPEDFTVTAECGIPLAELRALLEAHGQELPIEAAAEGAATLGGALAANACGARRRALGSPRDRILGARFVSGDGALVRTGGRVVKNVAGHAVHRLLVGSRGGLGVLVEASLKLLPMPPARAVAIHGLDGAEIADAARWAGLARREPAALTVLGRSAAASHPRLATQAPFTVVTGFEGDPTWVDANLAHLEDRLGAPHATLRDSEVPPLWRALADLEERPGPRLTFASAHVSPAALVPVLAREHADRIVFHAPAGRLLTWPGADGADALWRELADAGFAPVELRGVSVDGPLPPSAVLGLRAALAAALDPSATLAYGARWRAGR